MSKVTKKWLRIGLSDSTKDISGRSFPTGYTAVNYTPAQTSSEGTDKISAHIKGIDSALASIPQNAYGDVNPTGFNLVNNQSSFTDTGVQFSMGNTLGFSAIFTVRIDATPATYGEIFIIEGCNDYYGWNYSIRTIGEPSGVEFQVTSLGKIQYKSANIANFASGRVTYRISTTDV